VFNRIVARKAQDVVRAGRLILARLKADPRLSAAAERMESVQNGLETKVGAHDGAFAAEQKHAAKRREARRAAAGAVRGFGFLTLATNGNHPGVDPYRRLFPNGFGNAMQLCAAELAEFIRVVLAQIAEETDGKVVLYRDELTMARDALLLAEEAYMQALNARKEAFGLMQSEKRAWARGLAQVYALAEAACFFDRPYLRWIFAPAASPRRSGAPETPEANGGALTPAASEPASSATEPAGAPGPGAAESLHESNA
jgi:hypothetical protein